MCTVRGVRRRQCVQLDDVRAVLGGGALEPDVLGTAAQERLAQAEEAALPLTDLCAHTAHERLFALAAVLEAEAQARGEAGGRRQEA